jgi:hypothetical protein
VLQVKIGDFGFTKRLACNTASLKVKRITHPRWVAPEVSRMYTFPDNWPAATPSLVGYAIMTAAAAG